MQFVITRYEETTEDCLVVRMNIESTSEPGTGIALVMRDDEQEKTSWSIYGNGSVTDLFHLRAQAAVVAAATSIMHQRNERGLSVSGTSFSIWFQSSDDYIRSLEWAVHP